MNSSCFRAFRSSFLLERPESNPLSAGTLNLEAFLNAFEEMPVDLRHQIRKRNDGLRGILAHHLSIIFGQTCISHLSLSLGFQTEGHRGKGT